VIDYKYRNYKVQFLTKDNKLIMPVQITEGEIAETNSGENSVPDKLKTLLGNLENY
jgi:hypothetical protein